MGVQGSSVGQSFKQLRFMVVYVHDKSFIGVCPDTCHVDVAGCDISAVADHVVVIEGYDVEC